MAKKIDWPPPPERDALHQYFGQAAARLLAAYRQVEHAKGPGSGEKKRAAKAAGLDLLVAMGSPPSVVLLFDVMLGNVAGAVPRPEVPWLDAVLNYEARAHNKGRLVSNAEVVDKAILSTYWGDRKHVMRQVRAIRKAEGYPRMRDDRRIYLIDNPDSV